MEPIPCSNVCCIRFTTLQVGDMSSQLPKLLKDYQKALEEFDRASRALTTALVERNTQPDESLFIAEARARDAVVSSRLLLLGAMLGPSAKRPI